MLVVIFGALLLYAVFMLGTPVAQQKIPDRQKRDLFVMGSGLLAVLGGFLWSREKTLRSTEGRILTWLAIGLPGWALFQLLPLPDALVNLMSPARGELLRGLVPVLGRRDAFVSLSIVPAATLVHFMLFGAYAVLLLSAREIAIRARKKTWLVVAPLAAAGVAEAALSLLQFTSPGDNQVRGTYVMRNHLAGLLEMALPLVVAYAIARLRGARNQGRDAKTEALKAAGGFAAAVLMLTAALITLSRGGLMGLLGAALAMAAMSVGRDVPLRQRITAGALLGVAIFGGLIVLTPEAMLDRFATHSSEGRTALWGEAVGILRDYPLTGAGMGGFQTAFLKYKVLEGQFIVDYAHNDYLQGIAEMGFVGFLIPAGLIGLVLKRSVRIAAEMSDMRWIAVGCLGSVVAILVHSFVDFNLYVPANAAVLAWICGLAAGVTPVAPSLVRRKRSRQSETPEVEPAAP